MKEVSLYLENSGERAGNAQYGQMLRAADGKVGKPGGAGQEVVRVQCSRGLCGGNPQYLVSSLLFYISISVGG